VSVFDELRFGAQRTLNLREGLPGAADAVRRCERWLREQQVKGSIEVLIITGRGSQSIGGVAVVKQAVEKLLYSLRRRGVVTSHQEHTAGSFVVTMAPLRALTEAPARKKEGTRTVPLLDFEGLDDDTLALLRDLADRSLDSLGVTPDDARLRDEMHRQLAILAAALPGGPRMEDQLRATLRAALREYD
jgi:hypothetical protein